MTYSEIELEIFPSQDVGVYAMHTQRVDLQLENNSNVADGL